MTVPYTFGSATAPIPLSQLDSNFASAITLGNTSIQLGNTVTTLNNMTLANVTVSSGNVTVTNANVTTLIATNDATISGLTVGKGGGAVSTNTAVGASALASNSTGANVTALGYNALNASTASRNTAVGWNAASLTTSGTVTALGAYSLYNNTTGVSNTALGGNDNATSAALQSNTTGSYNIAVGAGALASNTTASNNTAVGYQAGYNNTTGQYNTAVGHTALFSNTTSSYQSAFGFLSLNAATGVGNSGFGYNSLGTVTTGTYNTAIGYSAGSLITTGGKNSILGAYNGNQGSLDIRTSSNNIVLSDGDGNPRQIIDSSGRFLVGVTSPVGSTFSTFQYDAATYNGLGLNQSANTSGGRFMLFTSQGTQCGVIDRVGTTSAVVYTATSDKRLKENIVDAPSALDHINAVKVRSYDWIDSKHHIKYGVIAQEFYDIEPDAVVKGDDLEQIEKTWSVDTSVLVPAMVKALQELKAIVDAQAVEIAELKGKA